MKYILLFLCILCLSCKYNVANPVMTLKDYTEGSAIIYYISSSSSVAEIEDALRKNKHSLGKYKIAVLTSDSSSTEILTNIATALKNNSSFNNVEADITKTKITEIPANIFKDIVNLSSIALPDTVKKVGNNAFSGCASLANVRFSKELTNIGDGAFSNCVSLTFIALDSDKLTTIGKNAFSGCSSLVNLILSAGLTNIDSSAFSGCSKLVNVEYLGNNKSINGSPFSSGSNPSNLYLPSMDGTTNKINSTFLGKSWATINYGKHIPN